MRVAHALILASLVITITLARPTSAAAASCQFVLGFKTLHDLIPSTVGDCLENEHFNSANGDTLQQTAKGLLVWRKADNWTAFTDGFHTWINGPNGLQERLNTERFPWEHDQPAATASCAVTSGSIKTTISPNGIEVVSGQLQNGCGAAMNVSLDVVGSAGSTAVTEAPTVEIRALPAGGSAPFQVTLKNAAAVKQLSYNVRWFATTTGFTTNYCLPAAPTRCIAIDPWLTSSLDALQLSATGQGLMNAVAGKGIQLFYTALPTDVEGAYSTKSRGIAVSSDLRQYSARVRAAVIAHEMQHASDDLGGRLSDTPDGCFQNEYNAFSTQSKVWIELWPGNSLPPQLDAFHTELDSIAAVLTLDPNAFRQWLVNTYGQECSAP